MKLKTYAKHKIKFIENLLHAFSLIYMYLLIHKIDATAISWLFFLIGLFFLWQGFFRGL